MENSNLLTDAVDSKIQIMLDFDSSQFKKEFPDFKDIFKHETIETVNNKINEFDKENNQNSSYPEHNSYIKKDYKVETQSKYDFDSNKSSYHNKIAGSIFKSENNENSVVKNTNLFSKYPQDFDKNKVDGSCFRNHIDPFKICVESFSETADFKCQYSKVHIDVKQIYDISAQENVKARYIMIRPERVKKQKEYVCAHCRQGFFRMANLKRHIYKHIHSKHNIGKYGSKHSQKCSRDDRLKHHTCSVHDKIKQHKCEICPYKFARKNHLKNHVNAVHYMIKEHKCELCPLKFAQKQNLKIHIDTVHKKIKHFTCEFCLYEFSRKQNLKDHIDAVHYKIKQHKCELCPYESVIKQHLKFHIDTVHNKIKQHKCEFCGYEFARKPYLKKHIDAVHYKIKQHKCEICPYESSFKQHLKIHIETVHNKIKKHKCELCSYAFSRKQHLKNHIDVVHLKIKQHKCEICLYESAYKQKLKIHIDTAHNKIK